VTRGGKGKLNGIAPGKISFQLIGKKSFIMLPMEKGTWRMLELMMDG
jgi:hypothetical protein